MLILVLGASASGKSEYAESLCMSLSQGSQKLYIATMQPFGEDADFRIARHRKLRAGKGFDTLEKYHTLASCTPAELGYDTILLECMSTLLANELFSPDETRGDASPVQKILQGVQHLQSHCENLVLIGNKVCSDGISYDPETEHYLALMGTLNQTLAAKANVVIEVTCGIPRLLKGNLPNLFYKIYRANL